MTLYNYTQTDSFKTNYDLMLSTLKNKFPNNPFFDETQMFISYNHIFDTILQKYASWHLNCYVGEKDSISIWFKKLETIYTSFLPEIYLQNYAILKGKLNEILETFDMTEQVVDNNTDSTAMNGQNPSSSVLDLNSNDKFADVNKGVSLSKFNSVVKNINKDLKGQVAAMYNLPTRINFEGMLQKLRDIFTAINLPEFCDGGRCSLSDLKGPKGDPGEEWNLIIGEKKVKIGGDLEIELKSEFVKIKLESE